MRVEVSRQQVTRNRDDSSSNDERDRKRVHLFQEKLSERMRNNEMDRKRAELLKEAAKKAAEEGMVTKEFVITKRPNSSYIPPFSKTSLTGYYKWLKDPPDDGTPIPDLPEDPFAGFGNPTGIWGEPLGSGFLELKGKVYRVAYAFAGEAVKEYNNRPFKDKIKLVKVTKGIKCVVAGYLYELNFDAKVLADGEEGRTQRYYTSLWLKIDGTLEVRDFRLVNDGKGNKITFWDNRVSAPEALTDKCGESDKNNEMDKKKDKLFKEVGKQSYLAAGGPSHSIVRSDKNNEMDKKKEKLFEEVENNSSSTPEGLILNVDEGDKNNEMDRKRAELLKDAAKKSSSAAEEGMVTKEFVITKRPNSSYIPPFSKTSLTGYYKWLEDPPDDGTPIPDLPEDPFAGFGNPTGIWGEPLGSGLLELKGKVYRVAYAFAGEAVKEYNNRQFKDKIKLVKVTKGIKCVVAGYLYELNFDAKVLADGEEGRTQRYYTSLWLKIDGTLEVRDFRLVNDGKGNKFTFWDNRVSGRS